MTDAPDHRLERRAGVLLPLASLRGRTSWGCGDIGDLRPLARWAAQAGLRIIQLLPVNATSGLDASPYAAATAFAIDPVYLDLDACEDFVAAGGREALPAELLREHEAVSRARMIQWPRVRALKAAAARHAFERFLRDEWTPRTARAQELESFQTSQQAWLDDYLLFAVLHARYRRSWVDWPDDIRAREPGALAGAREAHARERLEHAWMQWQLDGQWHAARADLAGLGVSLMGDLPFVSSVDSADVWANPRVFRLDLSVGTPPDLFSATGQDWGLPAYDWEHLERTGFAWLRARAARAGELYSAYRVDHVIGLYRTFVRTARDDPGRFYPAEVPAQIALGETILRLLGESGEVIAEDLGTVPEFLPASLERLGVPGYRVLRWQKLEDDGAFRLPSSWPVASVATNGTHDTDTSAEWYDGLDDEERRALARIPGLELARRRPRFDDAVRDALLEVLYAAPSELVLVPFQDLFGHRDRINVPGTVRAENWTYRLPMTLEELAADSGSTARLRDLALRSGRTRRA